MADLASAASSSLLQHLLAEQPVLVLELLAPDLRQHAGAQHLQSRSTSRCSRRPRRQAPRSCVAILDARSA
jgi:hypothetical protein